MDVITYPCWDCRLNLADPLKYGQSLHSFVYRLVIEKLEQIIDPEDTKDTSYLALTGELWGIYCEYVGGNWLSTTLCV